MVKNVIKYEGHYCEHLFARMKVAINLAILNSWVVFDQCFGRMKVKK